MVTKESTAHLLPEHWKRTARELAVDAVSGRYTVFNVESAILDLLDRCVKEAVLLNMAEMMDDVADRDELWDRVKEASKG